MDFIYLLLVEDGLRGECKKRPNNENKYRSSEKTNLRKANVKPHLINPHSPNRAVNWHEQYHRGYAYSLPEKHAPPTTPSLFKYEVTTPLRPNRFRDNIRSPSPRACSEGVITRGFQPLVPGSNPGGRTILNSSLKHSNAPGIPKHHGIGKCGPPEGFSPRLRY